MSQVTSSISLLPDLEDSQVEFALLRSCLSLPKLVFLLCSCPFSVIDAAIVAFDVVLRSAVSELVGSRKSDWSWLKATLPVSLGGLGIRLASYHAPAALIASVSQSAPLVSQLLGRDPPPLPFLCSAVSSLSSSAGQSSWLTLEDIDVPLKQKQLSRVIDQQRFNSLLASASSNRFKALCLSSAMAHAGDWLNAIPCGLHFQDWEFQLCLRYWLGWWRRMLSVLSVVWFLMEWGIIW